MLTLVVLLFNVDPGHIEVQTVIGASDLETCCCSLGADPANRSAGQTGSHLSWAKFPKSFLLQLQDCLCSFVSNEIMIKLSFGN